MQLQLIEPLLGINSNLKNSILARLQKLYFKGKLKGKGQKEDMVCQSPAISKDV